MQLAARIAALVIGEAGALIGLSDSALLLFEDTLGYIFQQEWPSSAFNSAVDGALTVFSLIAFIASIMVLIYPRTATYLLAISTLGVLVFGYLQLPGLPLPEPPPSIPQVPFYYWAITATPFLLVATTLAFLGREAHSQRGVV